MKYFSLCLGLILVIPSAFAATSSVSEQQLKRQIFMLEYALAPANPKATAIAWAQANKTRNGAVQYMLLCAPLKTAKEAEFNALNWVTGTSSPRITSYKIINAQQNTNSKSWEFDIKYLLKTDSKHFYTSTYHLNIQAVPVNGDASQQWCVSQVKSSSP